MNYRCKSYNYLSLFPFFYSAERDHYYGNRLKAEQHPEKYLSIIIDGMDQAKTNLPHVTSKSKVCYCASVSQTKLSHSNRVVAKKNSIRATYTLNKFIT